MCNPVLELQLWIHQQLERRYELLQGGAVEPGSQLIDEVSRAGMIRVHRTARISVHVPVSVKSSTCFKHGVPGGKRSADEILRADLKRVIESLRVGLR